jgi:hypothetical protein
MGAMRFPAAALFSLWTMIFSSAASGAELAPLVLGTATPGGGFAVYGQAVADTLREIDPTLGLTLQATGGSTENIPLLEAGKLDLALVEGTTAHEALTGIGRAPADLRLVAAMYPSPGMFVVRADSSYRTIGTCAASASSSGRRRPAGGAGALCPRRPRSDLRRDFDAVLLERVADGPPMVLRGEAAALWGAGIGWPGFAALRAARRRALHQRPGRTTSPASGPSMRSCTP